MAEKKFMPLWLKWKERIEEGYLTPSKLYYGKLYFAETLLWENSTTVKLYLENYAMLRFAMLGMLSFLLSLRKLVVATLSCVSPLLFWLSSIYRVGGVFLYINFSPSVFFFFIWIKGVYYLKHVCRLVDHPRFVIYERDGL